MKVITCVSDTRNPGYRTFLRASCEYHGLHLVTLRHKGAWTTHRLKDNLLASYLKTLPRSEVVLFTDGYDTMLTCSEGEILTKYALHGQPLVFTAERNCWPYAGLASFFPASPTEFRFLNSGGFMGEAGVIAELLGRYTAHPPALATLLGSIGGRVGSGTPVDRSEAIDLQYRWSNQYLWALVFLENEHLIALDHHANIFLSLATNLDELNVGGAEFNARREGSALYQREKMRFAVECAMSEGRLIYKRTTARPCQVHFNGPVPKCIASDGHFSDVMPWLATPKNPLARLWQRRRLPSAP